MNKHNSIDYIKVSVIIPCYNVEGCLNRAVESVLAQTHPNIELILIDNNSVDNTWKEMERYKQSCDNVLTDKQIKQGPCPTRNLGLELATGSWIQFLDADDIIEPDKIRYQLKVAQEAGLIDKMAIVVGQKRWIREDGTVVQNTLSEDVWRDLIHGRLGDTCANLWSKSIMNRINGWNEDLSSSTEIDLQFRALLNSAEVVYDQKPLTIIYERPSGSISKSDPAQNYVRVIRQRLDIRSFLVSNKGLEQYVSFLDYFIFNNLKLIYLKKNDLFDAIYAEVKESGFDVTKNSEELSAMNRFLIKTLGLRSYFKFVKLVKRDV